jgi:hypothetical protein
MSLVARVKGILLSPRTEWSVIEGETATVSSLYSGYVIPLAAIPAVAGFIGMSILGVGLLGDTFRVPIVRGLFSACAQYVGALVAVYVLALIIDALAPNFGGQKHPIQALKVATYASTASWVSGIFLMLPGLRMLGLLGLYSLYLLFLGLPALMKAPEDRALGYTAVVIVSAVVLFMVVGQISSWLTGYGGYGF